MHAYTYSAHPVGCAVAHAALDIIEGEDFPAQAREKGKRLLVGLKDALADHPNVGDIRGLGPHVRRGGREGPRHQGAVHARGRNRPEAHEGDGLAQALHAPQGRGRHLPRAADHGVERSSRRHRRHRARLGARGVRRRVDASDAACRSHPRRRDCRDQAEQAQGQRHRPCDEPGARRGVQDPARRPGAAGGDPDRRGRPDLLSRLGPQGARCGRDAARRMVG